MSSPAGGLDTSPSNRKAAGNRARDLRVARRRAGGRRDRRAHLQPHRVVPGRGLPRGPSARLIAHDLRGRGRQRKAGEGLPPGRARRGRARAPRSLWPRACDHHGPLTRSPHRRPRRVTPPGPRHEARPDRRRTGRARRGARLDRAVREPAPCRVPLAGEVPGVPGRITRRSCLATTRWWAASSRRFSCASLRGRSAAGLTSDSRDREDARGEQKGTRRRAPKPQRASFGEARARYAPLPLPLPWPAACGMRSRRTSSYRALLPP